MDQQQLQQAIEALKGIEEQIAAGKQAEGRTHALLQDALVLLTQERLIESVEPPEEESPDFDARFDQVLGAFEKAGQGIEDQADRLRMHLDVGDTLYRLGRRQEAQSHYQAALGVAETVQDQMGEAEALRRIGRLKRRQGRWYQARRALNRAAKLYRALDHAAGEAESLLNIGNIDFERGAYEQAETQFKKALALCADPDDAAMTANINLSLGTVHQVRGRAEEAIAHYSASLDAFETLGDEIRSGYTHLSLGVSFREAGAWDKAGENYEKSLKLARKHRDMGQIGMIYLRRAETQVLISDATMAMLYSRRAMRLFIRVEDPLGQADAYRLYGQAATIRKAWGQAHDYLTEGLQLQRKYKSLLGEAETLEAWGFYHEMRGDTDEAMTCYEQARNLFHTLQAVNEEQRIQDVIKQVAWNREMLL